MKIHDDNLTIMSKKHENLTAALNEYLSDDRLKVMDEVEFTVVTVSQINFNSFTCGLWFLSSAYTFLRYSEILIYVLSR